MLANLQRVGALFAASRSYDIRDIETGQSASVVKP